MQKENTRLDNYLAKSLGVSRKDAKRFVQQKRIYITGAGVNISSKQVKANSMVNATHTVFFDNKPISAPRHYYFMLNKPVDYVCSNSDGEALSAVQLIDSPMAVQTVGRLDKDTTGLLFITSDGDFNHFICSPKKECAKQYRISLKHPVESVEEQQRWVTELKEGMVLREGKSTATSKPSKPAIAVFENSSTLILSVSEGRYHLVKRLVAALGNRVEALHRNAIGGVELDSTLNLGESRELTENELKTLGYL